MNTTTPRLLLLTLFHLICLNKLVYSQEIIGWQTAYYPDNSYYDLAQVGPDEYWAAGEGGTLYSLDSTGNILELPFPDKEVNLLKILPAGKRIYLAADQGMLFFYDTNTHRFHSRHLGKKFDQLCIYDMMLLDEDNLLIVGGHNKIAKGEKTLPRGFIARIPSDLKQEPEIVWSNPFSFVWSVTSMPGSEEIIAASFNGLNTHILSSMDMGFSFQKSSKIQGLVHHLAVWKGEVWYSGTKDIRFHRQGIMGKIGNKEQIVVDGGCIWSILPFKDRLMGLNYRGELIITHASSLNTVTVKATDYSLYEGIKVSPSQALVIGHGRRLYLIKMERPMITYTPLEDLSQGRGIDPGIPNNGNSLRSGCH